MNYPYTCDGMITIECQTSTQAVLTKAEASELTALVARDINAVLQVTNQSALVVCGAGFTSEQLLQPKFPIQDSITQYASAAFQGQLNADQILSIGANSGVMPDGLQPKGVQQQLIHFPFCLYTHDLDLAERFEAELMHKGMVSPPTYENLSGLLGATINHANYMTYLDLIAMMHNHYEQLGMTHLWQIIETALLSKAPNKAVQTDTHNQFFLVDHLLFTPFFSWSQFQQLFTSSDGENYINWLMAERLSLVTLAEHGLEIKPFTTQQWPIDGEKICLGEFEKNLIKTTYWTESTDNINVEQTTQVVHYTHPQAGIVAIGVESSGAIDTIYYPVMPSGVKEIERFLQATMATDCVTIERDFNSHSSQLIQ